MAYQKIDNYPSYKKPGVYPSGSIKELGLNNDDLEKFSLGNWNSIVEDSKILLANTSLIDLDSRGRPVQLQFDDDIFTALKGQSGLTQQAPLIMLLIKKDSEGRIIDVAGQEETVGGEPQARQFNPNNSRDENGRFSYDDEFEYQIPELFFLFPNEVMQRVGAPGSQIFNTYGYDDSFYNTDEEIFPEQERNSLGMKGLIPLSYANQEPDDGAQLIRDLQVEVLSNYCLTNQDQELVDILTNADVNLPDDMVKEDDRGGGNIRYAFKFYGLKSDIKILPDDGFGYIQARPDDYLDEPRKGPFDILLDDSLLEKYRNLIFEREVGNEFIKGYINNEDWTHQIFFPRTLGLKSESKPEKGSPSSISPIIQMMPSRNRVYYPLKIPYDANYSSPLDVSSLTFTLDGNRTIRAAYGPNQVLNNNVDDWYELGAPFFKPNDDVILGTLNNSFGFKNVDYIVNVETSGSDAANNKQLLYYDNNIQKLT